MKNLVLLIIVSVVLFSCASTKVKVKTQYTEGISIDTLNLLSTVILPVAQPVLPLLDASTFNSKTNKIADQIIAEEQQIIEKYKTLLETNLSRLQAELITGSDFNSDAANQYKSGKIIQIDNKNFPVVIFSEGDLNFIDFGNGKNINSIFKNNEELKSRITKVASDLGIKNVFVSFNRLAVIGVGPFGVTGNLRLESYLYLFDDSGNLLIETYGWTKPTSIKGKEINEYKYQLDNFSGLSLLLIEELSKYIK